MRHSLPLFENAYNFRFNYTFDWSKFHKYTTFLTQCYLQLIEITVKFNSFNHDMTRLIDIEIGAARS